MMGMRRHIWLAVGGGLVISSLVAGYTIPRSFGLSAFGDGMAVMLLLLATAVMLWNALASQAQARAFWFLMTAGFAIWAANQALWSYYEVILRRDIPDPFIGDVILFLHVVPFMAAVALRPHRIEEHDKLYFSTLNFFLLVVWWVFLYLFVVFPDEYVTLNTPLYGRSYDLLYLGEDLLWLGGLGLVAIGARGAWRRLYWHFFGAGVLYTAGSSVINAAISRGTYYTGSLLDVPYVVSLCWFVWTGLLALQLKPAPDAEPAKKGIVSSLAPRLAMLAILSLPVMAYWALRYDTSPPRLRQFRLLVALAAMLVMGVFVFFKQYRLDHQLIKLLNETYSRFDNLQRLQKQVVQREKLASLGQMVAGTAHEISDPLASIMDLSASLSRHESLRSEQSIMAHKIGQQARRTLELVSDLRSFAQEAPADKSPVDVAPLLQRALQMETLRPGVRLQVETRIEPDLPRILGNANQFLQVFVQIISNAADALEEVGGGVLSVSVRREGNEVVFEFADTGKGMLEPERVFDPFYTTKPVGKGTGLGLSAAYGVVLHHHGQITCSNKEGGGAVFFLRFPAAPEALSAEAAPAGATP
jgi:signal transduction histidine kinase